MNIFKKIDGKLYEWYLKSFATEGDASKMADLGICYLEGTCNIKQNTELGLYWLNESIKNGYAKAMFFLGNYYINGKYVEQDYKKGVELLTRCVFHDDSAPSAYLSLALCYRDGKGVQQSIPLFLHCLKQCAKLGNPIISKLLYDIYLEGTYDKPDIREANMWLKLYYDQIKKEEKSKK